MKGTQPDQGRIQDHQQQQDVCEAPDTFSTAALAAGQKPPKAAGHPGGLKPTATAGASPPRRLTITTAGLNSLHATYDYQHAFLDMPLGADGLQKRQEQQEQHQPAAVLRFTRDLKVLRALQILFTCVYITLGILVLMTAGSITHRIYKALSNSTHADIGRTSSKEQLYEVAAARVQLLSLLAAVGIALAVPGLVLDMVWLALTASPRARGRSCGGSPTCSRFTCDMSWDILIALVWAAIFGLVCVSVTAYAGGPIQVQVVVALAVFALHIATAVLSGLVRSAWRAHDASMSRMVEMRDPSYALRILSASIV